MTKITMDALPTWDLSDLYVGVDDPKLDEDLTAVKARAADFEKNYKGTIATEGLTAEHLRAVLDEYEALSRAEYKPLEFASLLFTTDTQDPKRGALLQKTREVGSAIATHLVFFELEIGKIPQDTYDALIEGEALAPYRHYLDYQRALATHHLSEPEEKVLMKTVNVRGHAFVRLFTEINARNKFRLERDGKVQELTQSEILALLYDPDREVRKAAATSFTEVLQGNAHVCTFIYNTLLHEKDVLDRLRGYDTPEAARHLNNELTEEIINTMSDVCVANYDIVANYYHLKRRLLGLDELTHYDRYAPITSDRTKISFDEAKTMVLDAFAGFSPYLAEITEPFFSKRWIDAAPAEGKQGGAYCTGITPDLHPYVFMNYTGNPRDVMTLAHELGHGIHDVLASKNHLLDYHPVFPMAETASTFGEMLVFDKLQESLSASQEKLALLCNKIEDVLATVFRQIAIYRFEQRVHRARREQGELPTEVFNELWQTTMQEMFTDALVLGDTHAWWWLYISHIIQYPFYVYAYVFGELLVLALYMRYKREGEAFVNKYFDLLAAAGSKSPAELVGAMGFDIANPAFWQDGCALIRELVAQAEALAD
ncbi:MAG: M3 family oligoendopeptidase [Candidatus Bipolaricaulia bacterium]